MKIEARIFLIITAFCFVAAALYGWWTYESSLDGLEWVGTVSLVLSGGLLGIIGTYFQFVSRRIEARPEDRSDADMSDGAGDLGFFSPGSYWPIGIAAAGTLTAFSLAFRQWWMLVVGAVLIIGTVAGLLFEYYIGQRQAAR